MDFDEAIKVHSAWKMKLSQYIRNPDQSLNSDHVALDNQCALGKWIHNEGAAFKSFPEFAILKSEHAKFHKAAADVIKQLLMS